MSQWRLKNKMKDVLEIVLLHLFVQMRIFHLASRETKDCAENNPSFLHPIFTLSPPALCSWRLICMDSRKGLFGPIFFYLDLTKGSTGKKCERGRRVMSEYSFSVSFLKIIVNYVNWLHRLTNTYGPSPPSF